MSFLAILVGGGFALLFSFVFFMRALRGLREVGRALQRSTAPPDGPEPTMEDVGRLVREGRKIDAIRLYRDLTDTSLKDAKAAVEQMIAMGEFPTTPTEPPPDVLASLKGDQEFLALIRAGQKIDAIKLYRERTGVGLLQARQGVERLEKEIGD